MKYIYIYKSSKLTIEIFENHTGMLNVWRNIFYIYCNLWIAFFRYKITRPTPPMKKINKYIFCQNFVPWPGF